MTVPIGVRPQSRGGVLHHHEGIALGGLQV